ncbi:MAG TPA: hypothetical protein VGE10_13055 [Zeimonas sp.]
MSRTSTVRSTHRSAVLAGRILRAGCEMSFTLSLALFVASAVSMGLEPGTALRAVRGAMLQFGVPLLVAAMAVAAFAALRIAHAIDAREVHRLRERLYFVAALMLTVLVPSVLLGVRAMLMPRPGGVIAVHVVEVLAWLLATWLLWGNVHDARALSFAGGRDEDQVDATRVSERSMSSIR